MANNSKSSSKDLYGFFQKTNVDISNQENINSNNSKRIIKSGLKSTSQINSYETKWQEELQKALTNSLHDVIIILLLLNIID
jgi:hypothetical protein